jgi:hypothetical protein
MSTLCAFLERAGQYDLLRICAARYVQGATEATAEAAARAKTASATCAKKTRRLIKVV